MRMRLNLYRRPKPGRRGLSHDEHQFMFDQRASERECFHTPHIQEFLNREDVVELQAPSGWYHVFIKHDEGHSHFTGQTLTIAVEKAMGGEHEGRAHKRVSSLQKAHLPSAVGQTPQPA